MVLRALVGHPARRGRDMPVLITGASGFLGGALAASAQGPVLATGRDPKRCQAMSDRLGMPILPLDLTSPEAVPTLVRAAKAANVRRIVHTAGMTASWGKPVSFHRANVMATHTVLQVAQAIDAERVIMISSPSVYFRFADQEALREDDPLPPPVHDCAATMRQAELMALKAGAVVLRPRGIYGAGDEMLLPHLMGVLRDGPLPLLRGGRGAVDLTHVDDVTDAIWAALAARQVRGQILNISGGVALPTRMVMESLARRAGLRARWRRWPLRLALARARGFELAAALTGKAPQLTRYDLGMFAFRQTLDLTRARNLLNWQPRVSFDEGLARSLPPGLALRDGPAGASGAGRGGFTPPPPRGIFWPG